jgi:hypothetical protein
MAVGVNDILRITAVMSFGAGVSVQNVYRVKVTGFPTGSESDVMTDMAAWLDDAYGELEPFISSVLSFEEVRGFNETRDEPLPTTAWPVLTQGGVSVDYLPTANAMLVLFRTGLAKVIGRKFIAGLVEDRVTAGELTSTMISALAAYALTVMAGPNGVASGGTFEYAIIDKLGIARAPVEFVVRTAVAFQRRRKPGRGI